MENKSRFDTKGECRCDHIKEGTCHQTSCCDCCEFYFHNDYADPKGKLLPWQYIWGGEIRTNVRIK